jgi:hypothetical protein
MLKARRNSRGDRPRYEISESLLIDGLDGQDDAPDHHQALGS